MRALFLTSRMSDYMLNALTAWQRGSGVELHVVCSGVDAGEAPFEFSRTDANITFHSRETLQDSDLVYLVQTLQPQLIICSGWADKGYLQAVRSRGRATRAVMTMDNQWLGTWRQRIGRIWAQFTIAKVFDFIWVPGERQRQFAQKLGFPAARIREGYYVANDRNFTPIRESIVGEPMKRLVFVGRYVEVKGLRELWQGFIDYHNQTDSDLELLCIGTGPLQAERPKHPRIRHLGFVQPKDFARLLQGGGIFILPSKFEPWGVVVQEFALAGFPLILTSNVGAADFFLGDDNGILLPDVSKDSLIKVMALIDALSDRDLAAMSQASRARAEQMTVVDWVGQANAFLRGEP